MCWCSLSRKLRNCRHIAQEDIIVRKIVTRSRLCDNNIFYSYYQSFLYKLGMEYEESNLELNKSTYLFTTCVEIRKGFHSYSTNCKIIQKRDGHAYVYSPIGENCVDSYYGYSNRNGLAVVDCIIPKGTTYYENERGEIVSNKLIFKELTDFEKAGIEKGPLFKLN